MQRTTIQTIRATKQLTTLQILALNALERYSRTSGEAYDRVDALLQRRADKQRQREIESAKISKALCKAIG